MSSKSIKMDAELYDHIMSNKPDDQTISDFIRLTCGLPELKRNKTRGGPRESVFPGAMGRPPLYDLDALERGESVSVLHGASIGSRKLYNKTRYLNTILMRKRMEGKKDFHMRIGYEHFVITRTK